MRRLVDYAHYPCQSHAVNLARPEITSLVTIAPFTINHLPLTIYAEDVKGE